MDFKEFADKLKNVIGSSDSAEAFTKTLFETITQEEYIELIQDKKAKTFKGYFNGDSIGRISRIIVNHLDPDSFADYIRDFGRETLVDLVTAFEKDIPGINCRNAPNKIAILFKDIIKSAAYQKRKRTPKSPKKSNDTSPSGKLEESILASGKALAAAWENAVTNLNQDSAKIELPEEHFSGSCPFSLKDTELLQEFTSDYDEILKTMIGEAYAESLVDMSLQRKIKYLYEEKWDSKANEFIELSLKSTIFALLGELNMLVKSFEDDFNSTFSIKKSRKKMRNLYVKLHPNSFDSSYPYDAFIDDWDDGE